MDVIARETVTAFFDAANRIMSEKKDYLTELDAALGDGDLGLTMNAGFLRAKQVASDSNEADLGKLLMAVGMAIAKEVPSTMGTLVASGFMKAAKALRGKTELTLADFAALTGEFANGIMERGKANPGDRTIVDALKPAADSLALNAGSSMSLREAVKAARAASENGVEATKNMKAAFGRGVFFGDQVLGKPDQGAVVGMYIMQAWETAVCG